MFFALSAKCATQTWGEFAGNPSYNLKDEHQKNILFETRVLITQYNQLYEFFMSLQDPDFNFLLRNYEVFDTSLHGPGSSHQ